MYVLFMDHTFPIHTCPPSKYFFVKKMFSSFKIKAFRGFNHMLPSKVRQKSQQQHELHSSNLILGLEFKLPPPPHIVR